MEAEFKRRQEMLEGVLKEKDEEIESLQDSVVDQKAELQEIRGENTNLRKYKAQHARRWRYYKYKRGLCFYVIDSGETYENAKEIYKFGISIAAGDNEGDINARIQSHRSLWPNLRLVFLIYTPHAALLERLLKQINNDREIIEITLVRLRDKIFNTLNVMFNREYTLEDVNLYNESTIKAVEPHIDGLELPCSKCGETKLLKDFPKWVVKMAKGRFRCKSCIREQRRLRAEQNAQTRPIIVEKACSQCQEIKPVAEFNGNYMSIDGFAQACRSCSSLRQRVYRENIAEREGRSTPPFGKGQTKSVVQFPL
jgi:hypothetical protein